MATSPLASVPTVLARVPLRTKQLKAPADVEG